jgi:hypothetical protein
VVAATFAVLSISVRLDNDPRYMGSTHDDATAKKLGFRAALVPGAFIYGHVARVAVAAWGTAWLERGAIGMQFLRPVYNGDVIAVTPDDPQTTEAGTRTPVSVRNGEDVEVAAGWIALPAAAPVPPSPAELPLLPLPDSAHAARAENMRVGDRAGTRATRLSVADVRASRAAFQETHHAFGDHGAVHPGMPMRLAMGDLNRSFAFASPVILAAVEAQHFAAAIVGQTLQTSSTIRDIYEKKGRRYFVSDEIAIADGRVAARYRRTQALA